MSNYTSKDSSKTERTIDQDAINNNDNYEVNNEYKSYENKLNVHGNEQSRVFQEESNQIESNQSESNQEKSNQFESNQSESNQEESNQIESKQKESNQEIVETEQLKQIRENFKFVITLSLGFGLLFMFSFYDFENNLNGIVYPIFVVGLFIFASVSLKIWKKAINTKSYWCIIASILLGFSSFLTMNAFIVYCNTVGIGILFTIYLCKQFYQDKEWDVQKYFSVVLTIWFGTLFSIAYPFQHAASRIKPFKRKNEKRSAVLKGLLYGSIFLCIVLPLLSSADMVFNQFVRGIFEHIKNPIREEWYFSIFLFITGTLMFYSLFCFIAKNSPTVKEKLTNQAQSTEAIIMTGLAAVAYIIFCGIQIIYLFGANFFSLPKGITYAEYAHQGFFQLLFVVIINIGLVIFCLQKFVENKGLKRILLVISTCTFIMIFSAMYRMILYINVYHMTFLRVFVMWFLIVLCVFMIGVIFYIYHLKFAIGRYFFFTMLISYIIFAYSKPDYFIAAYNIANLQTITTEDAYYLTGLSMDATPALVKIKSSQIEDSKSAEDTKDIIYNYYEVTYKRYNKGIRNFNASKYKAYHISKNQLRLIK